MHVVGDMMSLNGYPGVAQVAIHFHAVASVKGLRFSGFFAWLLWLAVHIVYIVGFKKRITTVLHWAVSFVGRGRSERVATEQQVLARLALEEVGPAFVTLGDAGQDRTD